MTNIGELLLNIVIADKPKVLTDLSQTARSGLLLFVLGAHGDFGYRWKRQGLPHSY